MSRRCGRLHTLSALELYHFREAYWREVEEEEYLNSLQLSNVRVIEDEAFPTNDEIDAILQEEADIRRSERELWASVGAETLQEYQEYLEIGRAYIQANWRIEDSVPLCGYQDFAPEDDTREDSALEEDRQQDFEDDEWPVFSGMEGADIEFDLCEGEVDEWNGNDGFPTRDEMEELLEEGERIRLQKQFEEIEDDVGPMEAESECTCNFWEHYHEVCNENYY